MPLIYLDHAATSYPKPQRVVDFATRFLEERGANPGRGGYRLATEAEYLIDETRTQIARCFGFAAPERVIFTLNCTDALNIAIKGLLNAGDRVVTSMLEHNAVNRPLEQMARRGEIELLRLPPDHLGFVAPEAIENALRQQPTRLLILTHASNVIGTIQPIAEIGEIAQKQGTLFLVDAAQTAGVVPLQMAASQIDLLAFPGHKGLQAFPGTGVLCVGDRAADEIRCWREGGTGGDSSLPVHPNDWPTRLEAGTPNTIGIASLAEGLRIMAEQDLEQLLQKKQQQRQFLVEGLVDAGAECLTLGDAARYVATLSFRLPGMNPHTISTILDSSFHIATRAGLHCAYLTHQHLGTFPEGTVRISLGNDTPEDELHHFLQAIRTIRTSFG